MINTERLNDKQKHKAALIQYPSEKYRFRFGHKQNTLPKNTERAIWVRWNFSFCYCFAFLFIYLFRLF